MSAHIYRTYVRYNEVDQMGVVHNSIYYVYMELARCDMVRAAGYPYKRMEEDGIMLPVVESGCQFKGAAKYDDLLLVETTIQYIRNASTRINYKIRREDGTLVASGHTIHACVDKQFEVTFFPDAIRETLSQFMEE